MFIVLAVLLIVGKSTVMNMGFLGVVVINTVIGIFQEIRAKRAVDKLSLVARRPVKVVRDGQVQEVPRRTSSGTTWRSSARVTRSAATAFSNPAHCT